MNKTSIEWTNFTVNPFRFRNLKTGKLGHHCTKISGGCKYCFASAMQAGPYLSGLTYIEENKAKGDFFLDEAVLEKVLGRRKPARIFWCDMTDMFLDDYPDEWIDRCFAVMALTPHLTHQVLTKRAARMLKYFAEDLMGRGARQRVYNRQYALSAIYSNPISVLWPLPNVHLGVSVEDQPTADERSAHLRATPAAVRFISQEPQLVEINWTPEMLTGIDQIIIGGESGSGARPFDLRWARRTIAQCKAAGVACFVKQIGSNPLNAIWEMGVGRTADRKGGDPAEWPADLRVREMP